MALLAKLTKQGRDVSPNFSARYAPTVFAKHPDAEGCNNKAFAGAMERMLNAGRIQIGNSKGPPSRQYKRLVFAQPPEAE